MRIKYIHKLEYKYEEPVQLGEHRLCIKPRSNGFQKLKNFELKITPEPEITVSYTHLTLPTIGEVSIVLSVLLIPSRQYLTDLGKIGSSKRNLATELGFIEFCSAFLNI